MRTPKGILLLGSLSSEKLCVRLKAYLFLGSLYEREINQKLSSKINQKLHLGRTPKGILILGVALRARKIVQTECNQACLNC